MCFAIFAQKFENSKWPPFLTRQIFFENWHGYSAEIPCGSKISSKSLYLARFSRYISIFMFCNFCEKIDNSKWPPFLARQNFFENWHGYSADIPCGSKISSKSLYLAGFSRYKHFYVLQFLAAIFCEKFFFENWHGYSAEIPCGSKISSKSLYLAGFSRYKHFYVLQFLAAIFCEKFFFENWHGYSAEIPCGSKISSKTLYLAGFSRYKHFYVLQFLRKIRKFKMAAIFGETKFF